MMPAIICTEYAKNEIDEKRDNESNLSFLIIALIVVAFMMR